MSAELGQGASEIAVGDYEGGDADSPEGGTKESVAFGVRGRSLT